MPDPRRRACELPTACLLLLACAGGPAASELAACPSGPAAGAPAVEATPLPAGADAARGAELFATECARCHSPRVAERSSRLFRGYPRLDCAAYLERVSDAYLVTVISDGGAAVGLDAVMKPFGEQLSPAEIAALVAHLRAGSSP